MTRLLGAELRRFWSRRLLLILVVLEVMGIAFGGGIAFWNVRFELTSLPDVFLGTALILVIVGWVLGASFIGAEWHAGTVATLLTWEPRRGRVIAAKIVAALVSVFVLSMATQAVLAGMLAFDAATRGTTAGADGALLAEALGVALRSALLATFGAGVGFGLAAVGRNTAAALGVGFGYVVIVENLVRGLRPHWVEWLASENAGRFLLASPNDFPSLQRSTLGAGLYLAAVTALILLCTAIVFRARDVT